ncbi:MAG: histidine phosphatase family protein, partial [Armatimonadetes bacterium]|nr:histidine phosphatase family protein [Armatimonadota bacterium]
RRIAERHGIGIRALPDLRETMLGDWEGLTEAEIVARGEGERLAQYRRNPAAVRPPGSESVASIVRRIRRARASIAREHPSGSIAVVGHGGSLRVLFCEALGAPARCMFAFRLDNASVSVLDFGPIRSSILATNITYHLAKLSARAEAKP